MPRTGDDTTRRQHAGGDTTDAKKKRDDAQATRHTTTSRNETARDRRSGARRLQSESHTRAARRIARASATRMDGHHRDCRDPVDARQLSRHEEHDHKQHTRVRSPRNNPPTSEDGCLAHASASLAHFSRAKRTESLCHHPAPTSKRPPLSSCSARHRASHHTHSLTPKHGGTPMHARGRHNTVSRDVPLAPYARARHQELVAISGGVRRGSRCARR